MPTLSNRPRTVASLALLTVLVLAGAACSSDSKKAADTTTTTGAKLEVTTSETTAPTTPPATLAAVLPSTHVDASDALFDAWQAGNRDNALKVATPDAVNALFAQNPTGWYKYTYGGYCDTGEFDEGTCNYRDDSDHYAKVQLTHDQRGWQVVSVVISSNEGQG